MSKWTKEQILEALEYGAVKPGEAACTSQEAGDKLGLSAITIRKLCRKFGIKLKAGRRKGRISPDDLAHLRTNCIKTGRHVKTEDGIRAVLAGKVNRTNGNSNGNGNIIPSKSNGINGNGHGNGNGEALRSIMDAYKAQLEGDTTATNQLGVEMMAKLHVLISNALDDLIANGGLVTKYYAKGENGEIMLNDGQPVLLDVEINEKPIVLAQNLMKNVLGLTVQQKAAHMDAAKLTRTMLDDVREGKKEIGI